MRPCPCVAIGVGGEVLVRRRLRKLSYPDTDVFVVMFSLTSQTSLNNAEHKVRAYTHACGVHARTSKQVCIRACMRVCELGAISRGLPRQGGDIPLWLRGQGSRWLSRENESIESLVRAIVILCTTRSRDFFLGCKT